MIFRKRPISQPKITMYYLRLRILIGFASIFISFDSSSEFNINTHYVLGSDDTFVEIYCFENTNNGVLCTYLLRHFNNKSTSFSQEQLEIYFDNIDMMSDKELFAEMNSICGKFESHEGIVESKVDNGSIGISSNNELIEDSRESACNIENSDEARVLLKDYLKLANEYQKGICSSESYSFTTSKLEFYDEGSLKSLSEFEIKLTEECKSTITFNIKNDIQEIKLIPSNIIKNDPTCSLFSTDRILHAQFQLNTKVCDTLEF